MLLKHPTNMYLNCSVNCNKRIHSCSHIMWHGWHVSTNICIVPTQKRGCLKAIKDVWRNNTWKKDHKYFHLTVELLFQPVSHSFFLTREQEMWDGWQPFSRARSLFAVYSCTLVDKSTKHELLKFLVVKVTAHHSRQPMLWYTG